MSFVELQGLEKVFPDGTRAVDGIDLAIEEGEFIVLLGPSGCGKTTTLRMLAGLEQATAGRVLFGGRDVTRLPPSRRDVGFVFQFYALYPHLTVFENVAFPLRALGTPSGEVKRQVRAILGEMGMEGAAGFKPSQLGGRDR